MEKMLEIPGSRICVLIHPADGRNEAPSFSVNKITNYPYRKLLWNKCKSFWYAHSLFRKSDCRSRLNILHSMAVRVHDLGKNRERIDDEDINRIKECLPDVLFRFGFNILSGEILHAAPMGVWSFHHADAFQIRGGPMAFWEIYHRFKTTGVILQRLNEKLDRGEVLAYRRFGSSLHSYREQVERTLEYGIDMPAQVLRAMAENRYVKPHYFPLESQSGRLYRLPGNHEVLFFFIRLFLNRLVFYGNKYFREEHWFVKLVDNRNKNNIKIYKTWKDGYYADPFVLEEESGSLSLFTEFFDRRIGKGVLVKFIVDQGSEPVVLLEKDYHLAYPFVFRSGSDRFLLAEEACSGKVVLRSFLADGTIGNERVLLNDFAGVDPTMFFYQGKWWLWCTHLHRGPDEALYLFYADQPEGPYRAHAANPVKVDISCSRPAGRPVIHEGMLYRPAQDSSETYGGNVVWNQVLVITDKIYQEVPVETPFAVPKKQKELGMHHVDLFEYGYVYDLKSTRFSFSSLRRKLRDALLLK
jgi:hypothetical protein